MAWPGMACRIRGSIRNSALDSLQHSPSRRKRKSEFAHARTPKTSRFECCNFPPPAWTPHPPGHPSPAPLWPKSMFLLLVVFTRENGANLYLISMKNYAGETRGEPSPCPALPIHFFFSDLVLKLVRACSLLFRPIR